MNSPARTPVFPQGGAGRARSCLGGRTNLTSLSALKVRADQLASGVSQYVRRWRFYGVVLADLVGVLSLFAALYVGLFLGMILE